MARPLTTVLNEIVRVAKETERDPRSMTRDEFLTYSDNPTDVTKHDLHFYGGWAKLRIDAAKKHKIPHDKDLPTARGVEIRASIAQREDKDKATSDYFAEKVLTGLEDVLKKVNIKAPTTSAPKTKVKTKSCLSLLWSDLHFGLDVFSDEVLGAEYNWHIAARRIALLCKEAEDFYLAKEVGHRHDLLRIYLNGDIMHGVVHLTESNIKPMTEQVAGSLHILGNAIAYLSKVFPQVEVICLPGNHDRMTYRGGGRSLTQRWDSYASLLYISLESFFTNTKNVTFDIPLSGLAFVDDFNGGYVLCSHGDAAPFVGNVSKSLNVERMATNAFAIGGSGVLDKPVSTFLFGHWHTPTVQMMSTGQYLLVNGSLIGSEGYAQNGVNIFNATPAQLMFETTQGSPVKNVTAVRLRAADKDPKLDSIIPVPKIFINGKLKGVH